MRPQSRESERDSECQKTRSECRKQNTTRERRSFLISFENKKKRCIITVEQSSPFVCHRAHTSQHSINIRFCVLICTSLASTHHRQCPLVGGSERLINNFKRKNFNEKSVVFSSACLSLTRGRMIRKRTTGSEEGKKSVNSYRSFFSPLARCMSK